MKVFKGVDAIYIEAHTYYRFMQTLRTSSSPWHLMGPRNPCSEKKVDEVGWRRRKSTGERKKTGTDTISENYKQHSQSTHNTSLHTSGIHTITYTMMNESYLSDICGAHERTRHSLPMLVFQFAYRLSSSSASQCDGPHNQALRG